jgi:hypothetical protein
MYCVSLCLPIIVFILQLVLFLTREYRGPGQSRRILGTFTLRYRILHIRPALQIQDLITKSGLVPSPGRTFITSLST